jgi:hypothetical protein
LWLDVKSRHQPAYIDLESIFTTTLDHAFWSDSRLVCAQFDTHITHTNPKRPLGEGRLSDPSGRFGLV